MYSSGTSTAAAAAGGHNYIRNNGQHPQPPPQHFQPTMNYPHLEACRVVLRPERNIQQTPIRLPLDCIQLAEQTIPKPIDFTVGMC
jgi:hypothetical protein